MASAAHMFGTINLSTLFRRTLAAPAQTPGSTMNTIHAIHLTSRKRVSAPPATRKLRLLLLLLGSLLVLGNPPVTRAASAKNAAATASPAKISIAGIDNFGQVDAHLYRGAQPEPAAYAELRKLGIDTVVRLNPEGQNMAAEKTQVESLGMNFVTFPWSGLGQPTHEQVVSFLSLLRDNPDSKIFVHCRLGADRTGVMVALYRLTFDRWNTAQALAEMYAFHYHHLWLPHLQRYVESFPAAMATDHDLLQFDQPIASLSR
jgi:protein tyrosine phosphatase (PTP) superfamily phosphohydrolase (DUF442 family)